MKSYDLHCVYDVDGQVEDVFMIWTLSELPTPFGLALNTKCEVVSKDYSVRGYIIAALPGV